MLVLSRKIGETIIIGDAIRVTVVDIGQGRVKIGIHAPDSVSVDREEVHERKSVEREILSCDPEAAVPIVFHNRLNHLVDPTASTPAPTPKVQLGSFRRKPR
jgi:carbon storage regulator CsrA